MQQSRGWVHYAIHRPEPHIMLFRRPLGYPAQNQALANNATAQASMRAWPLLFVSHYTWFELYWEFSQVDYSSMNPSHLECNWYHQENGDKIASKTFYYSKQWKLRGLKVRLCWPLEDYTWEFVHHKILIPWLSMQHTNGNIFHVSLVKLQWGCSGMVIGTPFSLLAAVP